MERIIINGFFAKGNCGDESILQTWYDMLSTDYRIIASIDSELLVNNYHKKFELYNNIDVIQNRRVDIFCRDDIKAYMIGGGGLGLGFGIEQWIHAALRNKKLFYCGVITHDEFFTGNELVVEVNKKFFESFDMITVRDKISKQNLQEKFGISSEYYPDIAFALKTEKVSFDLPKNYVTVTIRHNGENDIESIKKWISKIEKFAESRKYEIIYLPFDVTDERLMKSIGIEIDDNLQEIYWQPKRVKYIISNAQMVFSLGRFHPLVFSISTGVTCYYIECQKSDYSWRYEDSTKDKSFNILNDWGLQKYYLTNDDLDCNFRKNSKFYTAAVEGTKQINEFFENLKNSLKNN